MRTRRLALLVIGAGALILAGWALHRPLLVQIGELLVFEKSEFDRVDAVIVLPGSAPDRVLGALELVKHSRASTVLLGRARPGLNHLRLKELGIDRMLDYEVNREVLLRKGVAEDRIKLLPQESGSTREDALALRRYLEQSRIGSVAIVTCKYHSYRAYLNFRRRLQGTGVSVYSFPSPHCPYNPQNWWTDRDQVKTVYVELTKLIAYGLGIS